MNCDTVTYGNLFIYLTYGPWVTMQIFEAQQVRTTALKRMTVVEKFFVRQGRVPSVKTTETWKRFFLKLPC
jgi:hypothetical protein